MSSIPPVTFAVGDPDDDRTAGEFGAEPPHPVPDASTITPELELDRVAENLSGDVDTPPVADPLTSTSPPSASGDTAVDADVTPDAPGVNASPPVTLQFGDKELAIANFVGNLPPESTAKDRKAFVTAAMGLPGHPDEDALFAVARALTAPKAIAEVIKHGGTVVETADTAELLAVHAQVFTNELFPLLQPRTEDQHRWVHAPEQIGQLDAVGNPVANIELRFEDESHLRSSLMEVITDTRNSNAHYDASILARRVSRPVLLHVVTISFKDGSPSLMVLGSRDGTTRIISSHAARINSTDPDAIAREMLRTLLASKQTTGKSSGVDDSVKVESNRRAAGRADIRKTDRGTFMKGASGPNAEAIRIGQTFTVPAQIWIGMNTTETARRRLPATELFNEAVNTVLSSIHVEFGPWRTGAAQLNTMARVLLRLRADGVITPDQFAVAAGTVPLADVPAAFDADVPATGLWRAVLLTQLFTNPTVCSAAKQELRALDVAKRIQANRYMSYLGPILDKPWRGSKHHSLDAARRVWNGGGPVPTDLVDTSWTVVGASTFAELVPLALDGDTDARNTLMVAGGIAMTADKVITSNVGSKVSDGGRAPVRRNPNQVVAGLGRTENDPAGLWLLAHAADAFQDDVAARNSFTGAELTRMDTADVADMYVVPMPDPAKPQQVRRDAAEAVEPVDEYQVVSVADPQAVKKAEEQRKATRPTPETPQEAAERMRATVMTDSVQLHTTVTQLVGLIGTMSGHPFATAEWTQEVADLLDEVRMNLKAHAPRAPFNPLSSVDDDEYGDDDNPSDDADNAT